MLFATSMSISNQVVVVMSCTDCVIKISSGEDNLTSPPIEEINLLGNVFHHQR